MSIDQRSRQRIGLRIATFRPALNLWPPGIAERQKLGRLIKSLAHGIIHRAAQFLILAKPRDPQELAMTA